MKIQEFDYQVDIAQSLLWQYNDAKTLISLVEQKQVWYDEQFSFFWLDWYNNVFNLITANFFGLSVWSIILDIPLYVPFNPEPDSAPIFGYNIGTFPTYQNTYVDFTLGNFSSRNTIIVLSLEEQRFILRLKYFKLVTRGAIPEINSFLEYLISTSNFTPIGSIYILDGFDMTITYVFNFDISKNLLNAIKDNDLMPRPAGVGAKYLYDNGKIFGFGLNYQNFTRGGFFYGYL